MGKTAHLGEVRRLTILSIVPAILTIGWPVFSRHPHPVSELQPIAGL
jgi:hypothetical protein